MKKIRNYKFFLLNYISNIFCYQELHEKSFEPIANEDSSRIKQIKSSTLHNERPSWFSTKLRPNANLHIVRLILNKSCRKNQVKSSDFLANDCDISLPFNKPVIIVLFVTINEKLIKEHSIQKWWNNRKRMLVFV